MIQLLSDLLPGAPTFVKLALLLGCGLAVGTLVVLLYLVALRLANSRARAIQRQLNGAWHPVFTAMQKSIPVSKPTLDPASTPYFLALWLEKREVATGEFATALDALISQLQLDVSLLELLRIHPLKFLSPSARQRAIAIRVGRWIDTPKSRRALFRIAESGSYGFAVQACETLLYLQDRDSTRLVVQLLFRYPEHDRHITTRLGHAGGARVLRVLDPFLDKMSPHRLEDCIYLIEQSGDKSLLDILVRRLRHPQSDEETASLLRAISKIGSARERELVLPYLTSASAFVRVQAASALRVVGQPRDAALLLPLLSDPEWWVRYRAAQSYFKLQVGETIAVQQLIAAQTDRFAKDILIHVNSERSWYLI